MAYLLSLIVNGVTRLQNDTHGTNIYADKHIKNNSNDNYILLGGGGHIDKGTFALANHGVHWEGFTKRATSSATWGTLISASGYTPLFWLDSTNGGGVAFSDKGGQTFMQIDGYFYQNEGTSRVTDVTETVTALSTSGNYLTWSKNGTTNNITVPYATNAGYASSAGNADTLDNIDSTGFLRQVVVPNNTENDFNTFSNMTLTGRVDPTTGASLKNAPWSGSGPAGGYGVLTYLFNGSGYGTQMAWGYNSNKIYIRNRYWGGSGVGSIWSTTWDAIALTSEIPTVTNYYWANVKIGAQSDSSTSPTFLNVYANGNAKLYGQNVITSFSTHAPYTDVWSDGTNSHPWYGYDHRYSNTGVYSTTLSDYYGMTLRTASVNISMTLANVGIGTYNPSTKLHVLGSSKNFDIPVGLTENSATGNSWYAVHSFTNPEMSTNEYAAILIGKKNNLKNVGHLSFFYAGDSSDNNRFALGFRDVVDLLVVKANGNVGIGTSSPYALLSVNGHVHVGNSSYKLSSPWKSGIVVGPDGTDKIVATYLASSTNGATVGAHNSALTAWAPLHLTGTKIYFRVNESLKMELTTGGQLAILKAGSAENSGLVVGGDSSKSNINTSVADQTSMIQIVAGSGGATNSSAIGFHNPGISSAVLEYKNASADLGYFNFRSDDKTWNVGIGTTVPNYKLDIVGDVRITSSDRYALEINSSIDNAIITFKGTDGSEKGQFGRGNGLYGFNYEAYRNNSKGITAFGVDDDSNFFLGTGGTPSVTNSKVVVLANGNMGIGYSAPSLPLVVKGAVWVDHSGYINNRATLILNSNNAPADIIFKNLSSTNGNYGHWALSSRSGETSTRFSIFRGAENANATSELELFTLRPNGDLDLQGTINLWNTVCNNNHDEGIRLHPSKHGWNALVFCGTDNTGDIGTSAKTWGFYTYNGNLYINKNATDASAANSSTLCNVSNKWGIGTTSPGYTLTVSGTTYADKSLIAISSTDANKYAGNANYYHLAIGSKATSTGASILLYRPDNTTQHAIVWCTGSGDHTGISVDSGSSDLNIWNHKGVLRLKKQTIIDNVEHGLQIYRTYNYHPCISDDAGRPGISISGNYPYLWLTGGGVANTSHGATITLAAPDTAGSINGSHKTWTFGVPGQNATWMDLAYSVNTINPHNGIADWQDGSKTKHRIMRWSTSPQNQVLIYGTGADSASSLVVNSSRTGTWIYGASVFAPNMSKGHNVWLNVGKANSTCNSFGISWHHAGGDGSASNYGAIEIWGKGNVQRWYGDLHTQFLGRVDVANIGYSTYNYDTASMQIREYNYGGSQTDTWGYAPRLAWHWAGRVAAQIGLASNGYLYTAPLTGTTFYKLVYESGTWGINITGSAGSATYARYVIADNNAQSPGYALLQSGSGRADASPGGDTWIYWDTLGGTSAPWGFMHQQYDNLISFYGAGKRISYIDLANGFITAETYNSWLSPSRTQLGRKDTTTYTDRSCVGTTDGNLHIDPYKNKDLYLNYYCPGEGSSQGRIYLNGGSYYIKGGYYNGTAESAVNADKLDGYHYNGLPYISTSGGSANGTISACTSGITNPGNAAFEAREYARAGSDTSIAPHSVMYAPRIGFHWGNRYWANLIYFDSAFRFMSNDGGSYVTLQAGTIYGSSFYESSDQRLKNFHNSIDANLDKLKSIPKKYFSWKKDNENKLHIGTSAQAIRELYPELVSESEDGMLSVDYAKLSIVALKAIDVLHDEIKLLKSTNSRLEKRIQELEK